jgi:steroid delta-isomerase-like uncharacterized protein
MKTRTFYLALTLCACGASIPRSTTMIDQNERTIARLYDECLNRGQLDLVPDLVSADYVGAQGERGADGFRQIVAALRSGVPDIHFTVEDVIASGDRVVARTSWTGTQTGPMRGIPPSGRHVINTGISIFQLRDGKIVRVWMETDRLGFLQQIGAVPENIVTPAVPRAE